MYDPAAFHVQWLEISIQQDALEYHSVVMRIYGGSKTKFKEFFGNRLAARPGKNWIECVPFLDNKNISLLL